MTANLIGMADIARLAGQSRATVGNWKSRNADFPPERGKGPRGPLYDRAEVVAWLRATNRLDEAPKDIESVFRLTDGVRGRIRPEDAASVLLALLALLLRSSPTERQKLREIEPQELEAALRAGLRQHLPFATELLPNKELPVDFLTAAAKMLSTLETDRLEMVADALLEQSITGESHRIGANPTPQILRELIIGLAEPAGIVYNPATGVGQLILDAARIVSDSGSSSARNRFFGQEVNSRLCTLARLNLLIHGVQADIAEGDVFVHDRFPKLRADCIISVPPWNVKNPVIAEPMKADPRWIFGEPGLKGSNAAWMQHCIYHLADKGRAVLVLPNGALFEGGRAGRVRERVIKAGLLDAVIALPPAVFSWTSVSSTVMVLAKRGGEREPQSSTLMVDLSASNERGSDGSGGGLNNDLVGQVVHVYRQWARGLKPSASYTSVAELSEIAANDFNITPARYLPVESLTRDSDDLRQNRQSLLREFQSLTEASRLADADLHALLEGTK